MCIWSEVNIEYCSCMLTHIEKSLQCQYCSYHSWSFKFKFVCALVFNISFTRKICVFRAVISGYLSVKAGESQIVVSGGQESMSQAPHTVYLRNGVKTGDCNLSDSLISDGLTDVFHGIHMGVTGTRTTFYTLFWFIYI